MYPIGIEPEEIAEQASGPLPPKLAQLKNELKHVKNIFSVERLDYSKGLPERFWRMKRCWKSTRSITVKSAIRR